MHRRAISRVGTLCVGVAVAMAAGSMCCDVAEAADTLQWKSFTINFQAEHGEKPDSKGGERKLSLRIPADMKKGEALRGFMPQLKGLDAFAHRNRIAMCKGLMGPYGGPNQAMRDAAAKATGHAELKHASAILQGLSYAGRVRAHYAAYNPGHTLAVILDHSWAPSSMSITPGKYSYGNLPAAQGVPFFFNASRNDSFQGKDRRALHYTWCTTAFRKYMQACTTVIHHERGGHGSVGSRDLLAAWLEEVLALRLPKSIPTDGSPYKLTPINPHKVGGLVLANLAKDAEGLTIHTDVAIGPVSSVRSRAKCNWWVPGGKSAAIYVDWVKRNGGKVAFYKSWRLGPDGKELETPAAKAARLRARQAEARLAAAEKLVTDKQYAEAAAQFRRLAGTQRGTDVGKRAADRLKALLDDPVIGQSLIDAEADAFEARCVAAEKKKDYPLAIKLYEQYVREFAKATRFEKVKAHLASLKSDKAIQAAVRSGQAAKECKRWLALADSYAASGVTDKARRYLTKIIEKYGDTDWGAKARARLAEIDGR